MFDIFDATMTLITIVVPIFVLAFILYSVRIFKGPSVSDMVLAVDALSFDVAAFMCLLTLYFRSPFLITGAIILSLWAFALDIFIAKYYEKKEMGG